MIRPVLGALLVLFLLVPVPGTGQVGHLSPEDAMAAISKRIMRETSFELRPVPLKPSLGIEVLDFGREYEPIAHGIVYAVALIHVPNDTVLSFGVSYDLPLVVSVNGKKAFISKQAPPFQFKEIGYELFRFNDTIGFRLRRGENQILIKAQLAGGRNVIYLREMSQPGTRAVSRFSSALKPAAPDRGAWSLCGVFGDQGTSLAMSAFPPDVQVDSGYDLNGTRVTWTQPRPVLVQQLLIRPDAVYRRESYAEWQYPNGTVLLALLDAAALLHDSTMTAFVGNTCRFTLSHYDLFKRQYERLHAFRGTDHKLIRQSMLDDTGAPALPFAELYATTHDEALGNLVRQIAGTVMHSQLRLDDGTFCRYERMPGTVWADDLFMSAPFLVRVSSATGDPQYLNEAAQQVVNFRKYLLDSSNGLWRHGWYDAEKRQSPYAWGRANGWVVWAVSEVLAALPHDHPLQQPLRDIHRAHLQSIARLQAPSGLWHQVLDHPETYEETSCTAMYIIGLARGIRSGLLDDSYRSVMQRAWSGLRSRISADGVVKDICRGTEMSDDLRFYSTRERFDNDPRGLGAVITACAEMMRMQNQ